MKKSVLVVSLALIASGAAAQEAPGAQTDAVQKFLTDLKGQGS